MDLLSHPTSITLGVCEVIGTISNSSLLPLALALDKTDDSGPSGKATPSTQTTDAFIQSVAKDNPSVRSALAQLHVTTNLMDAFMGGSFNADSTNSLNNALVGGLSTSSDSPALAQVKILNATYVAPVAEAFRDFLDSQVTTDPASVNTGPTSSTESFTGGVNVIANNNSAEGQYSIQYNERLQTFTLTERSSDTTIVAGVPSSLQPGVNGRNTIDFDNGISLSFDGSFDRNQSVNEMRFSISY
jgi:hypothetical protein